MQHSLVLSALVVACSTFPSPAQSALILPPEHSAAAGVNVDSPFRNYSPPYGNRELAVYDSDNFVSQWIDYPIVITGLRWRASDNLAGSWSTTIIPSVTVNISTAAVDYLATTASWTANHGPDRTMVYVGPVTFQGGSATGAAVGPWVISVQLSQPFTYNPNRGDLCIEVLVPVVASTVIPGVAHVPPNTTSSRQRHVFSGGYYPNPGGVDTAGLICEVQYHPAPGLHPGCRASATSGASPLTVQFTDTSATSDPGGVTSWAWDLDGDSIIDSTLQNPSFVYGCGTFDVSLTVTDSTHGAATITRTAYIVTDQVIASFTCALAVAPNLYQFTDTSTPPATAWAWDFDGDNVVDSTLQNPVWPLHLCQNQVRLTATRYCRSDTTTRTVSSAPWRLPTTFSSNNYGAPSWTVYFDANVANAAGITICGLEVNTNNPANVAFSLDAYVTQGSYAGKYSLQDPWRHLGSAAGTTAGLDVPSSATFAGSVYLPAGPYGIAIRYNFAAPAFTDGALGPYGNADVTLTPGAAGSTVGGPFSSGTFYTPRTWNGAILYDTVSAGGEAGYGFFGPGCPGPLGIVHLVPASLPQFGRNLRVDLDHLPLSAAIVVTGFSRTTSSLGALPLDLAPYGAPGCRARVSADATAFLVGSANDATWSFGVPTNATLLGTLLFQQALVPSPGTNALGAIMSDAAGLMIGY